MGNVTRALFVASLCLWTPLSWTVSRVGTGTLSNDENGFLAQYPPGYSNFLVSANQNFQLDGVSTVRGVGFGRRILLVRLLSNEYPQWTGERDRAAFRAYYEALGWIALPHDQPCVEQLEKITASGANRVLSWGSGLGIVASSPASQSGDMRALSDSVTIEEGFCSWN